VSIEIIKPGMLLTLQDLGRKGHQKYGIIESGAMDHFAMRAANLLVGNNQNEAVFEATILGPVIHFKSTALIAICGAEISPKVEGVPVPQWRTVVIKGGSTIKFGSAQNGARVYIAIGGGVDVEEKMGSRSTYLRAGIGGYKGRALKAGDVLRLRRETSYSRQVMPYPFEKDQRVTFSRKILSNHIRPHYSQHPEIRVLKGAHFALFEKESRERFFSQAYKVLPQSDRMGYRLEGPELKMVSKQEMLSEAVAFGTIQVPTNGQPIVLMADHQTTGGYPKIAQVISVDLPLMAQLSLGSKVSFKEVVLEEAQELYLQRESDLRMVGLGMRGILDHLEGLVCQ